MKTIRLMIFSTLLAMSMGAFAHEISVVAVEAATDRVEASADDRVEVNNESSDFIAATDIVALGAVESLDEQISLEDAYGINDDPFANRASQPTNSDPLEKINRVIFSFNETVDRYTLRPVAQVYNFVMPSVLNQGVSNVFSNAGEVNTSFNSLLQGKVKNSGKSTSRLLINSTLGMGGLFDVASNLGITADKEDFSQTLGVWGINQGPYIMLPLMGPTTVRGLVGKPVDYALDPLTYVKETSHNDPARLTRLVDSRSGLLDAEGLVMGDRYTFIRDFYLNKVEIDTHGAAATYDAEDDFVD